MRTARAFAVDPNQQKTNNRWPGTPLRERFWMHVDRSGDCWLWTARANEKGYGSFGIGDKKTALSHRVAWALERGPIPPRTLVLHSPECVSRACVRPDHLRLGTQKENVADAMALGRMCFQRGLVSKGSAHYKRRLASLALQEEAVSP
jgi:hypothetical protein